MDEMGRRPALAFGLAAITAPVVAWPWRAAAEMAEGEELAPGVRLVPVGKGEASFGGYKRVVVSDVVCQPGSYLPVDTMKNDMVCLITEGELRIRQNEREFRLKEGDAFTCAVGMTEENWNDGSEVAVMRVVDLLPA
jgi:quercetin dioxygenase-like cupin family protein